MNGSSLQLLLGAALGIASIPLLVALFRALTLEVEDGEAVLVTRFGKLTSTLLDPGLHVMPARLAPWVKVKRVSLRRDFRDFKGVHVNDARGTTVIVDLWLEFRIKDPARALFHVADWDRSLQNLVCHAATSILGNRDFRQILCDRTELSALLRRDIVAETQRWGLEVDLLLIRNVSLLPEVSRQIFEAVAARLERTKAAVEELGRLKVAKLEADTSVRVAALVAEAKAQYPMAVGRGLAELGKREPILDAYTALYSLSLVRPHRTVAFAGFAESELRAVDAAMLAPLAQSAGGAHAGSPRIGEHAGGSHSAASAALSQGQGE
jgi:regulator of protease activity HflC (stomatin/prohibitin superfamily)